MQHDVRGWLGHANITTTQLASEVNAGRTAEGEGAVGAPDEMFNSADDEEAVVTADDCLPLRRRRTFPRSANATNRCGERTGLTHASGRNQGAATVP